MISTTRARRAPASISPCASSTSAIWRPTGRTGLSAVIGSWKIIDIRLALSARIRAGVAWAEILVPEPDPAARHGEHAGRQQPHDRERRDRLARAALAHEAERLARPHVEGEPIDHARTARHADAEVADRQDGGGAHGRASQGSARAASKEGPGAAPAGKDGRRAAPQAAAEGRPCRRMPDAALGGWSDGTRALWTGRRATDAGSAPARASQPEDVAALLRGAARPGIAEGGALRRGAARRRSGAPRPARARAPLTAPRRAWPCAGRARRARRRPRGSSPGW